MTTPQPLKNANIRGKPLDLDDLLDFAEIDLEDIESAKEWWDTTASPDWIGALDSVPIDDNTESA